ncbi:hypothetical protein ACFV3E_46595 [Streptomyces sp. NPDC059718]
MEVIQRNSAGTICNITKSPDFTDNIGSEHHYGRTFWLQGIPVLDSCGSRVFTVRMYVQLLSGDNIKIDGSVPEASNQGETRTHAMLVNSNYSRFQIAFQAPNGREWEIDPDGVPSETLATLSPGTNPSLARTSDGRHRESLVASDGFLWQVDEDGSRQRSGNGLGVAAGTSPAIAVGATDRWRIAFQGGDHHLWTVDSVDGQHDTGLVMKPGNSPAIAALSDGTYVTVYAGADTLLRYVTTNDVPHLVGNGLGLAQNTAPATAANPSGGWKIAFQGGDKDGGFS